MRLIDDKIIYALNTSIPTTSFKVQIDAKETCKGLHVKIVDNYDLRAKAIDFCVSQTQDKVTKAADSGDRVAQRLAQTQVRPLRTLIPTDTMINPIEKPHIEMLWVIFIFA